jgi:trimeric autotransporter adhesin
MVERVNGRLGIGGGALLIGVGAALSCSAPTPTESIAGDVVAVIISPESLTVELGRTHKFEVSVLDPDGQPISGQQVFWAVEDPAVASVAPGGSVSTHKVGVTKVAASAQGRSGLALLRVIPRQVASITVSPSSSSIDVEKTVQLSATARDAWNDVIPGQAFTWSTSNASRATVSSSGLVRGVSAGQVTITASSGGRTGSATVTVRDNPVASVTVTPAATVASRGQQVQLQVQLRDAQGNVLTGRQVSWTSSNGRIATVNSSGLVQTQRRGSVEITATSEGVSGTARITIW